MFNLLSRRKQDWPTQVLFVIVLALLLLLGYRAWQRLSVPSLIEQGERILFDLRMSLVASSPSTQASDDIAIIAFDDPTLYLYEEELGAWPWSRQVHANIMQFLNETGVRLQAYDFLYLTTRKSDQRSDKDLGQTFLNTSNAYVGLHLDNYQEQSEGFGKVLDVSQLSHLEPMQLSVDNQLQAGGGTHPARLGDDGFYWNPALTYNHVRPVLPQFYQAADRLFLINHLRDADGISRSAPLLLRLKANLPILSHAKPFKKVGAVLIDQEGRRVSQSGYVLTDEGSLKRSEYVGLYPQFALRLLMDVWQKQSDSPLELALTPTGRLTVGNHVIPLNSDGLYTMHWYPNKPNTASPYPIISAWRILQAIEHQQQGQLTTNDQELMASLKNKMVFVGSTAVASYDIKTNPLHQNVAGVTLQATLFDNLYQGSRHLQRLPASINTILALLLSVVATLSIFRLRNGWVALMTVSAIILAYIAINLALFREFLLWLDLALPIICILLAVTASFIIQYISRDQQYEQTYKLATTDGLTGLFNHRYFQEFLTNAVEQADRQLSQCSLLLVDIDHFKRFNDNFGHQAGDQALRSVAETLRASVRSEDMVARYGGEEMAVVLRQTSTPEAMKVAYKLVEAINCTPFEIAPGVTKPITISVGLATYPSQGVDTAELIEAADQSLYRAKRAGRNRVGLPLHSVKSDGEAKEGA